MPDRITPLAEAGVMYFRLDHSYLLQSFSQARPALVDRTYAQKLSRIGPEPHPKEIQFHTQNYFYVPANILPFSVPSLLFRRPPRRIHGTIALQCTRSAVCHCFSFNFEVVPYAEFSACLAVSSTLAMPPPEMNQRTLEPSQLGKCIFLAENRPWR